MSTYSDKLKDPRWQKLRLSVFERDNWKYISCHSDKDTLHVHHLTYESGKNPWEYELDNFLTLCERCHEYETVLTKTLPELKIYSQHAKIPIFTLRKWTHNIAFLYMHNRELYDKIKLEISDRSEEMEHLYEDFFNNTIGE